jgi:hypothetical protein
LHPSSIQCGFRAFLDASRRSGIEFAGVHAPGLDHELFIFSCIGASSFAKVPVSTIAKRVKKWRRHPRHLFAVRFSVDGCVYRRCRGSLRARRDQQARQQIGPKPGRRL